MAPHDLLCKWCSTFVGKDKSFCSVFCESRFTRSKRRKLGFKRPVHSSGPDGHRTEYESPRANRSAPDKKEAFLEDVITAMRIDSNKDVRPDGTKKETVGENQANGSAKKGEIPKLDLHQLKDKNRKNSERLKDKPQNQQSPSNDSKLTIRTKTITLSKSVLHSSQKQDNNKSEKKEKPTPPEGKEKLKRPLAKENSDKVKRKMTDKSELTHNKEKQEKTETNNKSDMKDKQDKTKSKTEQTLEKNGDIVAPVLPRNKTKAATELELRIRSSGYGAPVNPKLRPLALKPRSATLISKSKRQSSASSTKSATLSATLPAITRDNSRPVIQGKTQSKLELIPTTIKEEKEKSTKSDKDVRKSLENEDPTPKNSPKSSRGGEYSSSSRSETTSSRSVTTQNDTTRTDLTQIREMLREESTASDLLDNSVLQERLSSIKRKVEVKRRGRDSRSSMGSELDSSFMDSTHDLTTDRDGLNTSQGKIKATPSARISARSNITRISQQYHKKDK